MPTSRAFKRVRRAAVWLATWAATGATLLPLNGCALAALPCRVTSATLKVVPVIGHAAATPFEICASAID